MCVMLALAACAHEVARTPTRFVPAGDTSKTLTVTYAAVAPLEEGYRAAIPGGSKWRLAGRIPQGDVYRPANGVFSISGRNFHEAYLVLDSSDLVGFYLPGEGAFAPLKSDKVQLKTE
jgi:hypothetical protein